MLIKSEHNSLDLSSPVKCTCSSRIQWDQKLLLSFLKPYFSRIAETLAAKSVDLLRTAQWHTFQRYFNS